MVADVAGGAPEVAAYTCVPLPHDIVAVLTEAVNDRTARAAQGIAHLDSASTMILCAASCEAGRFHFVAQSAEIVLEIVDPPGRIGLRTLPLMAVAAFVFGAGLRPGEE